MTKAVLFQGLGTISAHEKAHGNSDEEPQSWLRALKTCSPNFLGWLLWKHSGPVPHSLEIRNHHDTLLQPHNIPPPLSVGPREEGSPHPPAPSSGAAAPLVLVLENTLHSVLLPAELLCRLSKKGGQESVRGAEWAWSSIALHAGASLGQAMQLRQPSRADLGSSQPLILAEESGG